MFKKLFTRKPSEEEQIREVDEILRLLGYNMLPEGSAIALAQLINGYSPAEAASHIALLTFTRDVLEADDDVIKMVCMAMHAKAMIQILHHYREQKKMRPKIYKNDVTALWKIAEPSPVQQDWIKKVMSDPVTKDLRMAITRINYQEFADELDSQNDQ